MATGPVWVRVGGDGSAVGDWEPFDATLIPGDSGWFTARAHANKVSVVGGGTGSEELPLVFARVTDPVTGEVSELTFPGVLPVPVVAGPRATFVGVRDGVDMVVEVTSTGVEQFFVVHDPAVSVADVTFDVGVSVPQTSAVEIDEGVVEFVDRDDEVRATVGSPLVWDAVIDGQRAHPVAQPWVGPQVRARWAEDEPPVVQGEPGTGGAVDPDAVGVEEELVVEVEVAGDSVLVSVAPPAEVLARQDVVFPLVIDPSVSLSFTHDTFVQSDSTVSKTSDVELRIGTHNGGGVKARSFLNVNVAPVLGQKITSATVKLYQFH